MEKSNTSVRIHRKVYTILWGNVSDIEPIRKLVGCRLMSDKWVKEGLKQLDDMLTTLHQAGFITLMLEDGTEWQPPKDVSP